MSLINTPRPAAAATLNSAAAVRPAIANRPRRDRWSAGNHVPATLASLPTQPGRGGQR